jgi:hypothetical protein
MPVNSLIQTDVQNPVRFTSELPVGYCEFFSRDTIAADRLAEVIEKVCGTREIDTIQTIKHIEPDENGMLVTEFTINLRP